MDKSVLLVYCGNTEGIAYHMYSTLKIAKPSLNVSVFDGDYCYNIVLPYLVEEISSAILISSVLNVSCMYRVVQALLLMGIEAAVITPTLTMPRFRDYMSKWGQRLRIIELDNEVYRLSLLQVSLRLALELGGRGIARVKRFEKEVELKSIVSDLVDKYSNIIKLSRSLTPLVVAITRAILPAGEELMDRGVPIVILGKYTPEELTPKILVYTGVEEHMVNEYITKLARKGVKKEELLTIKLNTDPLTAPMYALTIFYAMVM